MAMYRERRYICGNYLESYIYPVFRSAVGRGRRKKRKPTSEVQARLNEINSERKLIRILNNNFTSDDIELHLTYRDDCLPETPERAMRDVNNYFRRIKRYRKKQGLPELKYVLVPAGGIDGKRIHFHITMNGGIDRDRLEVLWGLGYANSRRLQFGENGIEGLARYISRQYKGIEETLPFGKRYSCSRNIIVPVPQDRDGKISYAKVKAVAVGECCVDIFEPFYKNFRLNSVTSFFNDVNFGYYLCVRGKLYIENGKTRVVAKRRKELPYVRPV